MSPLGPGGVQHCRTIRRDVDESVGGRVSGLVTPTVSEDVDRYHPEPIGQEIEISTLAPKLTSHRGTVDQQQGCTRSLDLIVDGELARLDEHGSLQKSADSQKIHSRALDIFLPMNSATLPNGRPSCWTLRTAEPR
jgi:hypothetical protein